MEEQRRRIPVGIIASVSTIVLAAGSATAYFTWQRAQTSKTPSATVEQTQPPTADSTLPQPPDTSNQSNPAEKANTTTAEKTAQVYWLRDQGTDLALAAVPLKVKGNDKPESAIAAALNALFNSPPDKTMTTTVPAGTKLRSVRIKPEGIYVDLSKEFETGGGSLSMYGRVGQVLYTATSLNPKAPVFLMVEGKPLETLGGEGLMIDQPLTRSLFEQDSGQKSE